MQYITAEQIQRIHPDYPTPVADVNERYIKNAMVQYDAILGEMLKDFDALIKAREERGPLVGESASGYAAFRIETEGMKVARNYLARDL